MEKSDGAPRRRYDAEEKRRRVLDAAIATVVDVGYYKASSNEIARRAGVSWGSIQHLFGSREQLMLDVVNDIGAQLQGRFAEAIIEGSSLEQRLSNVLAVLATHYEQDAYLVQMQILMELSANPRMSQIGRRAVQRNGGVEYDKLAHPLLAKALGEVAAEHDLVIYAFMTMRGYLMSLAVTRLIAKLPENTVLRLMPDRSTAPDDAGLRDLLVRGIAAAVREAAQRRGYAVD